MIIEENLGLKQSIPQPNVKWCQNLVKGRWHGEPAGVYNSFQPHLAALTCEGLGVCRCRVELLDQIVALPQSHANAHIGKDLVVGEQVYEAQPVANVIRGRVPRRSLPRRRAA